MEGKVIALVPPPREEKAAPDASLICLIETLLDCAKRGELKGLVSVVQYQDGMLEFNRSGIGYDEAVAAHMRAIYKIQREIDTLSQSTISH